MFAQKPYRRLHAVRYAKTWALSRNPLFQDFEECGGDCTNFVSQCLFAGSCIMNETPTFGWYFRRPGDYAPAWTGVSFLYNFLTTNMESGPVGHEVPVSEAQIGDIVQLGQTDGTFYHSLFLSDVRNGVFLVCAHNNDALDRRLDSYSYDRIRFLHIDGVRFPVENGTCCFDGVLSGTSIFPNEQTAQSSSCLSFPATESSEEQNSAESSEGNGMG